MRVLVVAPSRKTKGGITAVVKIHEQCMCWGKWNCKWIESYKDGNSIVKIYYFIISFMGYVLKVPFANIVHIHFSGHNSLLRKTFYFSVAKVFNKKIVVHLHYGVEGLQEAKRHWMYKWLFCESDKVVFLSYKIMKGVINMYGNLDYKIIYNPAPKVRCLKIEKKKCVLYAGVLRKKKGYHDLIEAFSLVSKIYPDWKLVLAGNGEIDWGKKLAVKYGISDKVIFPGWIDGKNKERIFLESKIFCLPSYAEGFPMAILDAFAYGLPVIATSNCGLSEFIENKKSVLIYEPGDVDELATFLCDLISNQVLRGMMSAESVRLSNDVFGGESICGMIDDLYSELTVKGKM